MNILRPAALAAVLLFSPLASFAQQSSDHAGGGTIIEAPENLRSFGPDEIKTPVDAGTASIRQILEDLGPEAATWYQHVLTLANPFFEGRNPGTRGMDLAEAYMEFYFKNAGLEPAFPAEGSEGGPWTSYRQPFELPGGAITVTEALCSIDGETLHPGVDFNVLGVSAGGTVEAPVVFTGYAIVRGRDEYTSFSDNVDLTGKVALLFRYEPLTDDGVSRWDAARFSHHAAIMPKLMALAERKAAAIILVNPPGAQKGKTELETADSSQFGRTLDIPVIQLSEAATENLLRKADREGRSLMQWRKLADTGEVTSVPLNPDVKVAITAGVTEAKVKTANVGGVLKGKGRLADEWLIVGAHLDHVGFGYFGTNPANRGQLHPGADDNASGSAALLALAHRLFRDYATRDPGADGYRSILFLAFTAEESGLRGSRHYVKNPTLTTDRVSAMINMDMVGRLRSDTLSIGGVGSAEGFQDLLRPHFLRSGLTIAEEESGRGPSDHANFYGVGVPVLFAFTGMHPEYHSPQDKGWTVNPAGAIKVVSLMHSILLDLASQPQRLVFRSTDASPGQDRGYAPVRLGIQPGMNEEGGRGVLIEGVSAGTSAADAGLQPGDSIIAWNGEDLHDTGGMMQFLRRHKPGDTVKLTILRNGQEIGVDVTLKASSGPREGREGRGGAQD